MKKEFISVFQLSKTITFEVDYYTLENNKAPYFVTRASQFTRNKRDYSRCGQVQENLLPPFKTAYDFYKKWDKKHLGDLTEKEYKEMVEDLEKLKQKYNYMAEELNEENKPYNPYFSFYKVAKFTMQKPKKN